MMEDHDHFEKQLERLADTHVDDILNASDEQILSEAEEEYGDTWKAARHVNDLINKAKEVVGKEKLAAARASLEQDRVVRQCDAISLPLERKQEIIEGFAATDTEQCASLTLAARKGGDLSERDLDVVLQALFELGAIDEDGNQK